jgi:predicted NAD/FAD-binding protein
MRIAVIGAGVAGLHAAWRLAPEHDVTIYDAAGHAGGHTNTVDVEAEDRTWAVDTGFIVFNDWTYPHFIAMLRELRVGWQPSNMSFSLRCERSGLEYNGTSVNALFAKRSNALRPSFLRMIADILRFNRRARELLATSDETLTLGDYLERGRYSRAFVEHYIVPMGRAIWSAEAAAMLGFPARFFVDFFDRHGFLSIDERPVWQTVRGGSREYVRALLAQTRARVRLSPCAPHAATSSITIMSSWPAMRTRRCGCSMPRPSRKARSSEHSRTPRTKPCCTPTSACFRDAGLRAPHGTTTCCASRRIASP